METKKRRVWNTDSFAAEVFRRSEGRYILKGEYISYDDRIDALCKSCGNVFGLSPHRFIVRNNGCPYCTGNAGRDSKWLADKTFEVVGDEFTFLDEYKGAMKKHRIRHNPCGVVFEVSPSAFFNRPVHAKCPEEFRERVWTLVGEEYVFQQDYVGSNIPIQLLHAKCGRIYDIKPSAFLAGRRCDCQGSLKRLYDNYEEGLGSDFSLLSDVNDVVKISDMVEVIHEDCGTVFSISASTLSSGYKPNRCPECRSNKRKTTAQFEAEVYNLVGGTFDVLSGYTNRECRIGFRHNDCGNVFVRRAREFIKDPTCVECSKLNRSALSKLESANRFVEKHSPSFSIGDAVSLVGGAVEMQCRTCGTFKTVNPNNFKGLCTNCNWIKRISEFLPDNHTIIRLTVREDLKSHRNRAVIKHESCGIEYNASIASVRKGRGCPHCFSSSPISTDSQGNFKFVNTKLTQEMVEKEVSEAGHGEYVVSSEYLNREAPLEFTHLECGKKFTSSRDNFIGKGNRCPNCIYSRGEKAVADVLDSLSIEYSREHSFEYLGRKRYDFFIPSLNIAIEYDGEQHYEAVDAWGGEEYLEEVRQSDALKNDFCEYMGIDLLRIPYWEFDNIDEIVTNFIDTVKLMRSISANSSEMAKCR